MAEPQHQRAIAVAHVPAAHDYVQHLLPAPGEGATGPVVRALPDPPPATEGPVAPGQWWPPAWLEEGFAARHAEVLGERADVVHLHFGFEGRSAAQLAAWVEELRTEGLPLVLTVHDLRNPHLLDGRAHDEALDVLVPAADAVLTLTSGAAAEIRRRWGREAVVVPHPHVVPLGLLPEVAHTERPDDAGSPSPREATTVGVHLKSLRASTDARLVELLVEACEQVAGARLRVDLHPEVLDPAHPRHDAALLGALQRLADTGRLALHVHQPFDDAAFRDYLAGLDLAVLPYRFGTHSGWLEACHDLGTPVLAPLGLGYWQEQQAVLGFPALGPATPDGTADPDARRAALEGLVAGIRAVAQGQPTAAATRRERLDQRREVSEVHARLYARLTRMSTEETR